MSSKNLLKRLVVITWGNVLLFALCAVAQAETEAPTVWQNLETKYSTIRYQSLEDLKKFNDKVDYSPGQWSLKRLFSRSGSDDFTAKLKKKIDALYERVQEILDMRKKIRKVIINIYPNKKQLRDAYSEIYKTPCKLRTWYIYEHNTIYMSADGLHEGMLAHEMAHSIIDHYLLVRPPRATAEILARYVDKHLFE